MDVKKQRIVLAASVAGILAAAGWSTVPAQAAEGDVHCYGINKCAGTGECGGKGHSCAGQNSCQGEGFIDLAEEDCLRIQDGRLTAEPEAEES